MSPKPPLSLSDLRRVLAIVRRHVPRHLDVESIATDILIESWIKGHPTPSTSFIYNRCVDHLRSQTREHTYLTTPHPEFTTDPSESFDTSDLVNCLMTVLSPSEKQIIWYRFFREPPMSDSGISSKLGMPLREVQGVVAQALFKMRQATQE